jgi:hypothetical protein
MMKRLLGAHVESSHISTQVHGRYHSADARSAYAESKTISVDVVLHVVSPTPERKKKSQRQAVSLYTSNPTTMLIPSYNSPDS